MDNDKLIGIVREFPCLYDIDKRYSDIRQKDRTWKEVGKRMGVNGSDCKKAWTLLRDAFRRANRKNKDNTGPERLPRRKWKYEDDMSFLLPYIKDRNSGNDSNTDDFCSVMTKEEPSVDFGSWDGEASNTAVDYERYDNPSADDEPTPDGEPKPDVGPFSPATEPNTSTPLKRKRPIILRAKKRKIEDSCSTTLMKYILEKNEKTDDIDQFFAGMATTVKSFPLRGRAIAKAKVFEVISQMEIGILSQPMMSSVNHNSPYSITFLDQRT